MARMTALVLCALLSGCLADAGPEAGGDEPRLSTPSDLVPGDIALDGCTFTTVEQAYPADTAPGALPRGWERAGGPASFLRIDVWDCEDVLLAGERWGPTILLVEFGPSAAYHESCRMTSDPFVHNLVHAVWTDRADLAEAVRTRLGHEMLVGEFTGGLAADGALSAADWGWRSGDSTPSRLAVRQPFAQATGTGGFGHSQWIWFNATSALTIDIAYDDTANDFLFAGVGATDMHEPTLMAQDGVAQGGGLMANAVPAPFGGRGPVVLYNDLYCQDPIPAA